MLPAQLTLDDVIEIQPADPENGFPRIQARVVPDGVELSMYAEGYTDAIALFLTTAAWEKLVTIYVQSYPEQFKLSASRVLADKVLQRRVEPVPPAYLHGTMHNTLDLSHLLSILNSPPDRKHGMVRELIDAFLADGITAHLMELFETHSTEDAFNRIRITVGGIDHYFEIPVFASVAPVLHRLFTSKDPWRLKRCIECPEYFFDATKNGKQRHCTPRCKSRHTSRDYYRRRAQASTPS
jgi:hypothetical protein